MMLEQMGKLFLKPTFASYFISHVKAKIMSFRKETEYLQDIVVGKTFLEKV